MSNLISSGSKATVKAQCCLSAEELSNLISSGAYCPLKFLSMPGEKKCPSINGYFVSLFEMMLAYIPLNKDLEDKSYDLNNIEFLRYEDVFERVVMKKTKMKLSHLNVWYKIGCMTKQESDLSARTSDGLKNLQKDISWLMDNYFKIHPRANGCFLMDFEYDGYYPDERAWYDLCFSKLGQKIHWNLVIDYDRCVLTNYATSCPLSNKQRCMVLNKHFQLRLARFSAVTLFIILKLKVLLRRAKKERRLATWIFPKLVFGFDSIIAREFSCYCWGEKGIKERDEGRGKVYPRWMNWLDLLPNQSMECDLPCYN